MNYKKNIKTIFSETLTCILNIKIVKREYNLKNNQKFPKHNSTNSFIGNLNIYVKDEKQIINVSHPYKRPVAIFGSFLGRKHHQSSKKP